MGKLKASVIIPSYNGAQFIGDAIRSVLEQTYQNFEIIIVDDASTDNTIEVIRKFHDPRIKYFVHEVNQGPDAARRLAVRKASGDILVLLDQDDFFHPEKLQAHVERLEKSPEIDFTYNSRFHLHHSAKTIRELWRPPQKITLADLVLGFPISPSDMVIRRTWAEYLDLTKEPPLIHGGEYVITGRLFLSGCRFAGIDRALTYRAFHAGRTFSRITARCEAELCAQEKIFSDPRCPTDVIALRNSAFMNTYRIWAYYALAQGDTAVGQAYIRKAVALEPSLITGTPSPLMHFFMQESIADESCSHEILLKTICAQLPPELKQLQQQYEWATAFGYLRRGMSAVMWGRPDQGAEHFRQAVRWGAQVDDSFLYYVAYQLMHYELEMGAEATQKVVKMLAEQLELVGHCSYLRWLTSQYSADLAFDYYQTGQYMAVPRAILRAVANQPRYLTNRGILSLFVRANVRRWVPTMSHTHQV